MHTVHLNTLKGGAADGDENGSIWRRTARHICDVEGTRHLATWFATWMRPYRRRCRAEISVDQHKSTTRRQKTVARNQARPGSTKRELRHVATGTRPCGAAVQF